MRKIAVYTGSRANYSSTKTIIKALQKSSEFELFSIVGGAATLPKFGEIDKLMVQDGLPKPSHVFNMFIDGSTTASMSQSCALGLGHITNIFESVRPDAVIVVGDRFDILPPAIAASLMNITLVHTMGGEVTGTIDESIRHAVTKLANIHFVANEDARKRVVKMGEDASNVHNVGCPRMDLVKDAIETNYMDTLSFNRKYRGVGCELDIDSPFLLVSFHPVTSEIETVRWQVTELLEALKRLSKPTLMLWPNFDAGSAQISKAIRSFRENNETNWLRLEVNLSVEDYSTLMARTTCLVGNSSSGIREGAFIGTPVVNVGSRQSSRLVGDNVLTVQPDSEAIFNAIIHQLTAGKYEPNFIYGDGTTGHRIVEILKTSNFEKTQKQISF